MSYQTIQQSVRASTGTSFNYEEDWIALWDAAVIAEGAFNERMTAWINARLVSSYTDINDAMKAFAANQGFDSWGEMGVITVA